MPAPPAPDPSRLAGDQPASEHSLRVPFDELRRTLAAALEALGLPPASAALSARLIAETDRDGIRTHGLARFDRFATMVRAGEIDPAATPTLTTAFGACERWSGHRGPGNLAAHTAMARAMQLAETHGLGGVALADTSHWQRGGTFGWQAADAGYAAVCWTNTLANLPPWGATTPALGNNPLVIAVPQASGTPGAPAAGPVVLDMAMSQYSYGTLALYRDRSDPLPFPGGFDASGALSTDAAAIEASQRALPIGLWKGAGLSFALDVLAALVSGGLATHQLPLDPLREAGQSQIFLAFAPRLLATTGPALTGAIDALHAASPDAAGRPARYPGERVLATRRESMERGVRVDSKAWHALLASL